MQSPPILDDFYLHVPNDSGGVVFEKVAIGPCSYRAVGRSMLAREMKVPSCEDIAFLLRAAYTSRRGKLPDEFSFVRKCAENGLFLFVRNILAERNFYVLPDNLAEGTPKSFSPEIIERVLEARKEITSVPYEKFSPVSYLSSDRIVNDGLVNAYFGKNGARAIADVCEKTRKPLRIDIPEERNLACTVSSINFGRNDWASLECRYPDADDFPIREKYCNYCEYFAYSFPVVTRDKEKITGWIREKAISPGYVKS